jgi:transcriptional regulator with AAA-type ATPase domain
VNAARLAARGAIDDIARGRDARALRVLREAAWTLARHGAGGEAAAAFATLARLQLRRGRAGDAADGFAEACRLWGAASTVRCRAWRALALAEAGRGAEARAECDAAGGAYWSRVVGVRCAWLSVEGIDDALLEYVIGEAWTAEPDLDQRWLAGDTVVRALLAVDRVFDAGRHARVLLELASTTGDAHARAVAAAAHVAVLVRTGDRVLVDGTLGSALRAARLARAPVVGARARLAAGRAFERLGWVAGVRRERRHLERRRGALPAALRAEIDAWLRAATGRPTARVATGLPPALPPVAPDPVLPGMVGRSDALTAMGRLAVRAAAVPFPVLVEGESGVGKELVARGIHQLGPRRGGAFCAVNCAAFPDELLDAELFGHARGAFTGAVEARVGLFEAADGGTLFLDEVADLTPRAQAKLLRVLQEGEVRRIGESEGRRIDVRVVAAANRDLRAEAAAGLFRPDLVYRLDVIRIKVPPLRPRGGDIGLLARAFWKDAAARAGTRAELSDAVIAALTAYDWPGNVRELQNVMAALAVAAPVAGRVAVAALPPRIADVAPVRGDLGAATARFEREVIADALARAAGNRTRAASALGLTRQGLRKKMARLGLAPSCQGRAASS